MNTKAAVGLVAAIIILVGVFFFVNHKAAAPVLSPTATSTNATSTAPGVLPNLPAASAPAATGSGIPGVSLGQPMPTQKASPRIAAVDTASLHSSSSRPTITGTASANVKSVGIVLDDPSGVGIAGSSDITVEDGHWSFTPPQALTPGTYTIHLIGGDTILKASLVVSGS